MKQLNPHAEKYHTYYMDIAIRAAQQSVAVRRKVGAVIVTNTGLMAVGWNVLLFSYRLLNQIEKIVCQDLYAVSESMMQTTG